MKSFKASITCFVVLLAGCVQEQSEMPDIPVIPAPVSVRIGNGFFGLDHSTGFRVLDEELFSVTERFAEELRLPTGLSLPVSARQGNILVSLSAELGSESYVLDIADNQISLQGGDAAAVFYGLQTLRQLLPPEIEVRAEVSGVRWTLAAVFIEDAPRFSYRGLHLDVGRHFFDVGFIKKYIDTMSRYKFNVFHWGLTQDQGWRIEIRKYPRLTEVGAWRKETVVEKRFDPYVGDGVPHGGFYTQDEIRDVVRYAAERFVMIVPEIEMPGHSTAALAAYPEYGCTDGPYEVSTTWGIKSDIYCPSEATFEFLTDILAEVIELFPGNYIHIGADEVPKVEWEESELAQAVMRRENLADEEELQSWFIRRIESFLNENDRDLIGWDEILQGGLAPNATVMSWRGMITGIEAARMGHDVIMTPTRYTYFDFYQGNPSTEPLAMNWAGITIPLDTVYAFEPVPPELSSEEAKHILGAQANVWTEYIATPERLEYMVFPRALALSEVLWSPVIRRDIDSFNRRLRKNLAHLESLGVNYRIPEMLDTELLDTEAPSLAHLGHGASLWQEPTLPRNARHQTTTVSPGMAAAYNPRASGRTRGSASHAKVGGMMETSEFSASSHWMTFPE